MSNVFKRSSGFMMILFFALALLACPRGLAQLDQGTITGVVQDTSAAVVPGAQVTLTDVNTGLVLKTTSDHTGIYTFPPVKVGLYIVTVSAQGFKTTAQENVRVNVGGRANVTVVLSPGSVGETVTVSTAPPLLQTQSASVEQVISTQTINTTALNDRNWVYIAQLTPGVAVAAGSRGAGGGDFEANGQDAGQNNFIIDGVDNNSTSSDYLSGASYVVRPPPDALAEFKIATSSYSAEYGHSAGAVVSASIKSGTNDIHGDLWEYIRNNDLDARDFSALTIPKYRQNQFGAGWRRSRDRQRGRKDWGHGESDQRDQKHRRQTAPDEQDQHRRDGHRDRGAEQHGQRGGVDQNARGDHPPDQEPQREAEREDVQRGLLGDAARDEILGQPVPDPHFAAHIQEQKQPKHKHSGIVDDAVEARKRRRDDLLRRGHASDQLKHQRHHAERSDRVAEPLPAAAKRFAAMKGVTNPPRPKKRFTRFRTLARWSAAISLVSAFALVMMMPPPRPRRNISHRTGLKPEDRGNAPRAAMMNTSPRTTPTFLPSRSSRGPTESEARISPSACMEAMLPFCRGVNLNLCARSGSTVPSMAAIMP